MNRAIFFDELRRDNRVFGGSLSDAEVQGTEAILDASLRHGLTNVHHVAFVLTNVYRETGGYMMPIKETVQAHHKDKNPSDAEVIRRLENAWVTGKLPWVKTPYWRDGGFGRGQLQISHVNYAKMGRRLGLPLAQNRDLALQLDVSADIAVIGMAEGLFTGKKLSDYDFPRALQNGPSTHPRRIVNGTDGSDAEVSRRHWAFVDALVAAGWGDAPPIQQQKIPAPWPKPQPEPEPVVPPGLDKPASKSTTVWSAIVGFVSTLLTSIGAFVQNLHPAVQAAFVVMVFVCVAAGGIAAYRIITERTRYSREAQQLIEQRAEK